MMSAFSNASEPMTSQTQGGVSPEGTAEGNMDSGETSGAGSG